RFEFTKATSPDSLGIGVAGHSPAPDPNGTLTPRGAMRPFDIQGELTDDPVAQQG
ncbi:MAG: hypothetical protein RL022_1934, partial [Chloroflexota bacterium]